MTGFKFNPAENGRFTGANMNDSATIEATIAKIEADIRGIESVRDDAQAKVEKEKQRQADCEEMLTYLRMRREVYAEVRDAMCGHKPLPDADGGGARRHADRPEQLTLTGHKGAEAASRVKPANGGAPTERIDAIVRAVEKQPGISASKIADIVAPDFPGVTVETLRKNVCDAFYAKRISRKNGLTPLYFPIEQDDSETRPRNGCAMTPAKVRKVRELWSTGKYLQKDLAEMFGLSSQNISRIVQRKTWKEVE